MENVLCFKHVGPIQNFQGHWPTEIDSDGLGCVGTMFVSLGATVNHCVYSI